MKFTLLTVSMVFLTGCATPDGGRFIPIIDPVPGYQANSWAPYQPPGSTTVIVNGSAYSVSAPGFRGR